MTTVGATKVGNKDAFAGFNTFFEVLLRFFRQAVEIDGVARAFALERDAVVFNLHDFELKVAIISLVAARRRSGEEVQEFVVRVEREHCTVVVSEFVERLSTFAEVFAQFAISLNRLLVELEDVEETAV